MVETMTMTSDISLARTVRLFMAPGEPTPDLAVNSYAALVSTPHLGVFYEFTLHCSGQPQYRTGFVESIYEMDRAVHGVLAPRINQAFKTGNVRPHTILQASMHDLDQHLDARLTRVDWQLTPTYRISMEASDMTTFLLAQNYQFAASHKLHNPEYDDATNRSVFGKCCNPNGHGHNYRLEVEIAVPSNPESPGHGFSVIDLDEVVQEHVIDDFDHTYLNLDIDDFSNCNPTVENITLICHKRLMTPLKNLGVKLRRIRLWETEKTCCAYPAEA